MKKYWSEFLGTFFIIFFGCGSMVMSRLHPLDLNPMLIPIVFGIAVASMIYTVGHISGAHFNPAVTIAFWMSRNFPRKDVFPYIAFQFSGALFASMILRLLFLGQVDDFGVTDSVLGIFQIALIEFIISFALMFVISSVATDSRAEGEFAGLAIGMIVFLGSAVFGPLTGASMNPARSLAPAIVSGHFNHIGIYLSVPIVGTVAGAFAYKKIKE